ncbi:MAG TPA: hypothetical protein VNN72_17395, partial [Polyangiaceae bacterium]|nr:hypothetical protein [Polyangiaceae bacterium]
GAGGSGAGAGAPGGPLKGFYGDGHLFSRISSSLPIAPTLCSLTKDCDAPQVCFLLTSDFGLCDTPQPTPSTECTGSGELPNDGTTDECGCDGLTCAADQTCVSIVHTCSCAPAYHNVCVASACAARSDCPDGTVCTPSSFIDTPFDRCQSRHCTADSECTVDGPGRCALFLNPPLQGGETHLDGVECVYAGSPSDSGVCNGARSALPNGHTCP